MLRFSSLLCNLLCPGPCPYSQCVLHMFLHKCISNVHVNERGRLPAASTLNDVRAEKGMEIPWSIFHELVRCGSSTYLYYYSTLFFCCCCCCSSGALFLILMMMMMMIVHCPGQSIPLQPTGVVMHIDR